MQDLRRAAALRAALQFVISSDFPSEHKAILIDVLTKTLRDEETAELDRSAVAAASANWQEHEIAHLKSFLQGRLAKSWQHADEGVMQLRRQLHRDPKSVRDKATQLGLGTAVDYRLARAMNAAGRE